MNETRKKERIKVGNKNNTGKETKKEIERMKLKIKTKFE